MANGKVLKWGGKGAGDPHPPWLPADFGVHERKPTFSTCWGRGLHLTVSGEQLLSHPYPPSCNLSPSTTPRGVFLSSV